jgi:hypothetical protein
MGNQDELDFPCPAFRDNKGTVSPAGPYEECLQCKKTPCFSPLSGLFGRGKTGVGEEYFPLCLAVLQFLGTCRLKQTTSQKYQKKPVRDHFSEMPCLGREQEFNQDSTK